MPETKPVANFTTLDSFTRAYIDAALWSSTDDDDKPLDANYGPDDLAPATLQRMIDDCRTFQEKYGELLTDDNCCPRLPGECSIIEYAGHDFWLTRNGHGAGFWDGDWAKPAAQVLNDAAHSYGEFSLYVGDDGLIYA